MLLARNPVLTPMQTVGKALPFDFGTKQAFVQSGVARLVLQALAAFESVVVQDGLVSQARTPTAVASAAEVLEQTGSGLVACTVVLVLAV